MEQDHFKRDIFSMLFVAFILGFAVFCYEYYQRGAVGRYLSSPAYSEALAMLSRGSGPNSGVHLISDPNSRVVMLQIDVKTQAEFDLVLKASKRPGRPSIEQITTKWQGTNYEF